MPITTVSIPGIHCEGCASLIRDVSADNPQISRTDVDLNSKTVTLEHGPDFDLAKWTEEIESLDAKYKVQPAGHPLPS